jgi:cell division protein FtsB
VKKDAEAALGGLIPRRHARRVMQYALAVIGCVMMLNALVGDKGVLQMLKKRQEVQRLDQALAAAQAENALLRLEVQRLRSDPAAIEDLARRNLDLIKPGEKLFIIRDARPGKPSGSQ